MEGRCLELYKRILIPTGVLDRPFKWHVTFVCKNTIETNAVLTQTLSNSFEDVSENAHFFFPVGTELNGTETFI